MVQFLLKDRGEARPHFFKTNRKKRGVDMNYKIKTTPKERIINGKVIKDVPVKVQATTSNINAIKDLHAAACHLMTSISTEGEPTISDVLNLKLAIGNFPMMLENLQDEVHFEPRTLFFEPETDKKFATRIIKLKKGKQNTIKKEKKCSFCNQTNVGQTGEYACPECGLPTVWDKKSTQDTLKLIKVINPTGIGTGQ